MLEIASRIERVRVGRTHAEITRTLDVAPVGEGDAASLPARFVIPALSLALDDASVRVAVDGPSGVRVKSARVTLVAADRGRSLDDVERDVRDAALGLALARRLASICEASIARLRAVPWVERPKGKRSEGPPPSPIDARVALARLQRERGDELAVELLKRRAAIVDAEKRHREALARLAQASSARAPQSDELKKAIVVDLDPSGAPGDARARLLVSYVVPGARWMPAYTLRIRGGDASVEIRALVQQNTGEDWSRVALSLSTADADRMTELPELASARIGRAQPKRRTGFRAPPTGADELYADYLAARVKRPVAEPPPPPPRPSSTTTIASLADELLSEEMSKGEGAGGGGVAGLAANAAMPMAAPADAPGRAAPQAKALFQQSAPAPMKKRLELKGRLAVGTRSFDANVAEARAGGAKPSPADDGVAAEVDVDARSLAFGSLRMPAPDAAGRGELRRVDVGEAYAEVDVEVGISVRIQASAAIAAVLRSASHPWLASPPARHVVASSYSGFDFSFDADAPVDIPSDGEPHAVALSSATAPAKVFHVVVPRESRDVFRCLEVTSPLDAPLLQGPLDVYEGQDFLLSTDLATTAPKGILRVGLGVDSAVKVARNVDFGETITGLMRGNLDLWHKVSTEITNGRRDSIRIDVRERVPTTLRDKDVKVEVSRVEPMWKGYEDPTHPIQGAHVWQLDIPAGEKRATTLEYVVHIAAKHELQGGNRREE